MRRKKYIDEHNELDEQAILIEVNRIHALVNSDRINYGKICNLRNKLYTLRSLYKKYTSRTHPLIEIEISLINIELRMIREAIYG